MTVGVVMTTANRTHARQGIGTGAPLQNYVGTTLAALAAQGVAPHLFATAPNIKWLRPFLAELPSDCRPELHVPTRLLSRIENGAAAMLGAPECDWVLHLEDDVRPCADALGSVRRWLAHHAREDRRLVLFWSRDTYPGAVDVGDHPRDQLFGAVAVALRRDDALDFGAWVKRHARRWRSGTARLRGFDKMLRAWHRDRYPDHLSIAASVPSLFQHIGEDSSLSHLWPHATGCWTSPHFTGAAYE